MRQDAPTIDAHIFTLPKIMANLNRGRFTVELAPNPRPMAGGFSAVGLITRQGQVDTLLTDSQGGFYALTSAGLEPLKPAKVLAAIATATGEKPIPAHVK